MDKLAQITASQIRTDIPEFRVGDTVRVGIKIEEKKGDKVTKRVQNFEGIVIAIQGGGISQTFTVRKLSDRIGVEKTFPRNSPKIESVEVVRKGKVRRAKLHYLRNMAKKAKIKERN